LVIGPVASRIDVRLPSLSEPTGWFEFAFSIAFWISAMVRPRDVSWSRSASIRTAYFWLPNTETWATPGSVESSGRIVDCAKASTSDSLACFEVSARNRIGWSAGFTLRNDGGAVMSSGKARCALEIADCTSSAAPSMSRLRSNCRTIDVLPSDDVDDIDVTSAMVEKRFSNTEATDEAIVSGLAPGTCADTLMVGKSTRGTAATGSCR
jgi:hypothetical protein